jgi:hypothetical protein
MKKLNQPVSNAKKIEGRGSRRKLYYGELHNFYSSPNIIGVMKLKRTNCMWHVACMEETEIHT